MGVVLLIGGCDWTPEPVEERSLVVESFLKTGRSLSPVILRKTRPLSVSSDSLGQSVSGAEVTLALADQAVSYSERAPGRYAPEQDLVVPSGVPWRLSIEWRETMAQAKGVTPPPIEIEEVCVAVPETPSRAVQVDSLRRDSLDIPAGRGYLYPVEVTVRWEGTSVPGDDSGHWVRAQLRPNASPFPSEVVEFFLEPAQIQREVQFPQRNDTTRWRGVYAVPVDSSKAPLPAHDLTTALVRGDSSFAAFAQTRVDPDRREPISNVEGALGIALSISVDSLTRVVEPGLQKCRTRS
jgi:hypothetical protein